MYNQQENNATVLGKKPLLWQTAGNASMPAPTVVPATRAIAPGNDPGSRVMAPVPESDARFDHRRSLWFSFPSFAEESHEAGFDEDETSVDRRSTAWMSFVPVDASSSAVASRREDPRSRLKARPRIRAEDDAVEAAPSCFSEKRLSSRTDVDTGVPTKDPRREPVKRMNVA
jgi:hypothetical protein